MEIGILFKGFKEIVMNNQEKYYNKNIYVPQKQHKYNIFIYLLMLFP